MKKSLFTEVVRIARSKLPSHPERSCYCHYSFVIQDNKIVEWGTNNRHEPPKHYGYHRPWDGTFRPKFHSEAYAYKRARGLLTDDSFEIINVRLVKSGELRLSKPCRPCFELLASLGCKRFYYSSEVGFMDLRVY